MTVIWSFFRVYFTVCSHIWIVRKLFSTFVARISFLTRMGYHVSSEKWSENKFLSAIFACVLFPVFISIVDLAMNLEPIITNEFLPTPFTFMRLDARMNDHMRFDCAFGAESFSTINAFVKFHSVMNHFMDFQARSTLKRLWTLSALIRLFFGMHFNVRSQNWSLRKWLSALIAMMRFIWVVNLGLEMYLQLILAINQKAGLGFGSNSNRWLYHAR